ncbi:MAG: hypothetical protein ABI690_30460 [Chloroflexota bacterium]
MAAAAAASIGISLYTLYFELLLWHWHKFRHCRHRRKSRKIRRFVFVAIFALAG